MNIYPKKLMLLGSGELGKEFVIAAKRLGLTIIACDRYSNAPAMQVADISEVFDMNNGEILKKIIYKYNPDLIIPEIEALAVDTLIEIEKEGVEVIPNARATSITMNRDKIRNLASNELGLKTAKFAYATSAQELEEKSKEMAMPLLIKPVMSSSGKGQSLIKNKNELKDAWINAIEKSRGSSQKIIIEEYIEFDYEITLLTIRQKDGSIIFCPPIGHEQKDGDYQKSWQPAQMKKEHLQEAQNIAKKIVNNLGGKGLFGVEFFIKGEEVIFSELSPRPHDTGLVTIVSQSLSEFELHLRAILGLSIPEIKSSIPAASHVILSENELKNVGYTGVEEALSNSNIKLLIFGKPNARKGRRMGVVLALGQDTKEACWLAQETASKIRIIDKK
tara:strand:+ start:61 stop:1230 length:1170 start_codon:yes stop_codon:yes gene_type:complete